MKLTCIVQIYNEMKKDNLPRFLDSVKRYCDTLIIYNDGSTDGTVEYLARGSHMDEHMSEMIFIHGEKNNFKNEIQHKQQMLEKAVEIGSDWIFWLDCDETVEARGEDGGIREICENATCNAYGFKEVNLWRDPAFYRLDNAYNDGEFCRLWKNTGDLYYDDRPGLHQRQYPNGIDRIDTADIKVIHYGFSSDDRIIDKYLTYRSHGQSGWALSRLIDERTLRVAKSRPEWFRVQPAEADFNQVFQTPVAMRIT